MQTTNTTTNEHALTILDKKTCGVAERMMKTAQTSYDWQSIVDLLTPAVDGGIERAGAMMAEAQAKLREADNREQEAAQAMLREIKDQMKVAETTDDWYQIKTQLDHALLNRCPERVDLQNEVSEKYQALYQQDIKEEQRRRTKQERLGHVLDYIVYGSVVAVMVGFVLITTLLR